MGRKGSRALLLVAVVLLIGAMTACSKSEGAPSKDDGRKAREGVCFPLDPFIVNTMGADCQRVVQVKMQLELADEKIVEKAKLKTPHLRDAVILILAGKAYEELITQEGKEQAKGEIRKSAEQFLGKDSVYNVYFTDFVVQ